jgi:hypothetical protein
MHPLTCLLRALRCCSIDANASSSRQSSRHVSPERPAYGAWGTAGHGAGNKTLAAAGKAGGGSSSNLASELIKNKYGGSDSMHTSRSGTPLGSQQGSPTKQPPAAAAGGAAPARNPFESGGDIDGMFASVEGRKSRARQDDSQRLVDSSAENSSGGFGGFKWKGAWREK